MPIKPPKVITSEGVPDDVRKALYELIAHTLREETSMLTITVKDVTYEGNIQLGDFSISIERTPK